MTCSPITIDNLYALRFVSDPQLSPDGSRVVLVVTTVDRDANDYRSQRWIVLTDGSTPPRPLTAGATKDIHPLWSPNGRHIVFVSNRESTVRPGKRVKTELPTQPWVLDPDGGEAQQVMAQQHGADEPAWVPDSRCLAFVAPVGGEDEPSTEEEEEERQGQVRITTTLKYKYDGEGFLDGKRKQLADHLSGRESRHVAHQQATPPHRAPEP